MKRILIIAVPLLVIAAACVSVLPGAPVGQPSEQPAPTSPLPGQEEPSPVEVAVIKQLAGNLGLESSQIFVVSNTQVEFSDACLGVTLQDVMCAEVITPGHVIVLEANDVQYEYHTSEDGARIQPARLALTWKREGGLAGFCDSLTVFLSGEVYGNRCAPVADGRMSTFASMLSSPEQARFQSWIMHYGQLSVDASDPKGVSDRMLVTLSLAGTGNQVTLSSSEEQALLEFARSLYQRLYEQDPVK